MTRGVVGVGRAVWLERVALVAVGAGLYALLHARFATPEMVAAGRVEPPVIVATQDTPPATVGAPAMVETTPGDPPAVPAREAAAQPAPPDAPSPGPAPPADLRAAAPPEPEPSSAVPLHARPKGDAPELPLTRMPGANQLRAGKKWDPKRSAWVVTRAYEVPAARAHVAAFYSKAIEDQGLEVSTVEGAPDTEGVAPLYIKGRSTGQHAHITIRQDAQELRTRVRVIWRTYAEAPRVSAPDAASDAERDAEGDEA